MPALLEEAVLLHRQGNLDEAERRYLQILDSEPASFAARHLLGVVRYQQGRSPEALDLITAALATNPDSAEALSNCGAVLKSLGRAGEALELYDKALVLKPGFIDALVGRAATLSDLNRFAEALSTCDQALALQPGHALALRNRGLVQQYLGRLDAARADFLAAMARNPGLSDVYLDYADLAPVRADDPLVQTMAALRQKARSDHDRMMLDFALAKVHADLQDHRRSFGHLLSGNALKRARIAYDETAMLAFFDRIESVFSAELLRAKEALGGGSSSAAPIFILGMMRSGSTLVEQILASHPQIHGAGELTAFGEAAIQAGLYPECAGGLDAEALRAIAEHYLARLRALAPGALHVTDKMPSNYFFAGLIHLAFPNARIIHTMRDPVDTCVSCFSKLFTVEQFHTYDLAELGRYYRAYQSLMAHWRRVLPPRPNGEARMLDVRYEDVVDDLETQARRIIAHCGLEWDARCLSFQATERPVRTASVVQVRQPLYRSAVGRAQAYEEFLGPLRAALSG